MTTIGDGDASSTLKAGSTFKINGDNLGAGNDFKGFGGGNTFFLTITTDLGNNTGANPLTSLAIEGDDFAEANPGTDTTRNQLIVDDNSGTARTLNFLYVDATAGDLNVGGFPILPVDPAFRSAPCRR